MSKIDVSKLAETISLEAKKTTLQNFKKLADKRENSAFENSSHEYAFLLQGILDVAIKHSEQFTIELLQKIVDEL